MFKPNTDFFHGFKLNDGVTIDLNGRSTPMPVTSRSEFCNTLTFEDNATIAIDVTESPLRRCGKVVSWEAGAAPANIGTLKFTVAAGSESVPYKALVCEDGIYLVGNGTKMSIK